MKSSMYFLLFLNVLFCNNAFTQNDVQLKNEFGYQFNFVLNQWIFSKNSKDILIDFDIGKSSIMQYRRYINSKNALLIGGSAYSKKSDFEILTTIDADYMQTKKGYLLRLGWERYRHISEKGSLYYGTEVLLSHQKFNARIWLRNSLGQFPESTRYNKRQEENEIGLVPKLGFRYQVNHHLSLSISSNLLISKTFFNDDTDNPFFSEPFFPDADRQDRNYVNIIFQNPTVIYFRYRFGKN